MSKFIPKSKHDIEAIQILSSTPLDKIEEAHLSELLIWLQDINWPVASPLINFLSQSNINMAPQINEILSGTDDIWKYNIISYLMTSFSIDELEPSMDLIIRIINTPTMHEIKEEVDLVAKDIMILYSHS